MKNHKRSRGGVESLAKINRTLFWALCVLVVLAVGVLLWSFLPKTAREWNDRGESLANNGKYEKALECFNRAVELDPGESEYLSNRGNVRLYLGDFEGAVRDFSLVIKIDPRTGAAYYNRGIAYTHLGLSSEAAQDLDRACELGIVKGCDAVKELKLWP
ncbi:MAG: tetratricopeptide repeat protein [Deltaproteobacteria bacterium]|nr:tetratricopeptide repeat protein [Candidatus Zymogenaceae bacterium]